jgi:hypothetical protein
MRFSNLAPSLFIAIPAAYAAVCPQQFSVGHTYECAPIGERCTPTLPCCGVGFCHYMGEYGVCHITSTLLLTDQDVRNACNGTTSVLV